MGSARLSEVMDEIRGTSVFRDLLQISFDNSGTLSGKDLKEKFFFGHSSNLQIMWEYCYLSKVDMDISGEELDRRLRSDLMIVENFKRIT